MSKQLPKSNRIRPKENKEIELNLDSDEDGWERAPDYSGSTIESSMRKSDEYKILNIVAHRGPVTTSELKEINKEELDSKFRGQQIQKAVSRLFSKKTIDRKTNESPYEYMANEYGLALLEENHDLYGQTVNIDSQRLADAIDQVIVNNIRS